MDELIVKKQDLPMIALWDGEIRMKQAGQFMVGLVTNYQVVMSAGMDMKVGMGGSTMCLTIDVQLQDISTIDIAKNKMLAEQIVLISKEIFKDVGR